MSRRPLIATALIQEQEGGATPPSLPRAASAERSDVAAAALILGALAFGLAPLIPNHYPPWTSFHSEVVAFAGLGLLCFAWSAGRAPLHWPRLSAFFAMLATVPLLQASLGLVAFWGDAWVAAAYLAAFSLSVAIGKALCARFGSDAVLTLLGVSVVLSALLSLDVALEQWLRLDGLGIFAAEMPPDGRPFGNVAQPNQLATWLMFGLVSLHLFYQSRRIGPLVLGLGAAALCFGIAMTQSRSGMLQIGVLTLVLVAMRRRAGLRISRSAACACAAFFFGCVLAWPWLSEQLLLSAGRTVQSLGAPGTRAEHWAAMVEAITRQPLLGYGWNQASLAQAAVAATRPATGEMIDHSHNIVLDLMVWNGVVLGLVICGVVAAWFVRQVARCNEARAALLLGAIAIVLTHGMLELPLEFAYFLLPIGLMIGIVEHLAPSGADFVLGRGVARALALALFVLLAWIGVEYAKIEESYRDVRFEQARIGLEHISRETPDVKVLTQLSAFLRLARTPAARAMSEAELERMRVVARRFGYSYVLFRYAQAAGLNNQPGEASWALSLLCKTNSPARCREGLDKWRELSATSFPELANVRLPERPSTAVLRLPAPKPDN